METKGALKGVENEAEGEMKWGRCGKGRKR
jgi:hypothetical protein